jgi:glycerophosphoryl diester phosphodiesterase
MRTFWLVISIFLFIHCSSNKEQPVNNHSLKIIAHRGYHLNYPENSVSAIQAAIKKRFDFVEVDVRTTKDGQLILMHDQEIDRTTNGSGKISAMSLEQVKNVNLITKKNLQEKVPLFAEAIQAAKGKMGLYVDVKDASSAAIIRELEKYDMVNRAVIYADWQQLAEMKQLNPNIRIMPEIETVAAFRQAMNMLQPRIVAMSWDNFSAELVSTIKEAKVEIFLDILGDGDNPAGVRQAAAAGIDGVQSDHPEMVAQVLKEK